MPSLIDNGAFTQKIQHDLKLAADQPAPRLLADGVVPILVVNDQMYRDVQVKGANRTTTGSTTLYTSKTNGDCWITALHLMLSVSTSV